MNFVSPRLEPGCSLLILLGSVLLSLQACEPAPTGEGDPEGIVESTSFPGDDDDASNGGDDDTSPDGGDDDSSGGDDDDASNGGDDDSSGGDDDDSGTEGTPRPIDVDPAPEGFYIVGSFPQDGAMLVPRQLYVELYFSEPYPDDCPVGAIHATLTGLSDVDPYFADLGDGSLSEDGLSFGHGVDLPEYPVSYRLDATIDATQCDTIDAEGPVEWSAEFATYLACGVAFDVFAGMRFTQVGGDPETAEAMTQLLKEDGGTYPTGWIFSGLDSDEVFPISSVDVLIAGLQANEDGTYTIHQDTGVTSTLEGCGVDVHGAMTCAADRAVFPIDISTGTTLYLYLNGVHASATLSSSGDISSMEDFLFEGAVYADELSSLLADAGIPELYDQISMDIDSDGDGVGDAATVRIVSDPLPAVISQCL